MDPATLQPVADPLARVRPGSVVLLGEQHDSERDHQWQLHAIKRLDALNPALVLGFEMFPRVSQPVLDRWVRGQLSEAEFLRLTDWKHVWGFDPALYLPIFRYARDHHLPMLALNVSARLVHEVAQHGWNGVAPADREGVGPPAAPAASYRRRLAEAMSGHSGMTMTPARLSRFIDAQLVWDRAMAEAIAAQRAREPQRPVVALIGEGHLQFRDGVPHQLDALGVPGAVVLLPVHAACAPQRGNQADAFFIDG